MINCNCKTCIRPILMAWSLSIHVHANCILSNGISFELRNSCFYKHVSGICYLVRGNSFGPLHMFLICSFVLVVVSILGSDSGDMFINVGNAYVQCSRFVKQMDGQLIRNYWILFRFISLLDPYSISVICHLRTKDIDLSFRWASTA